MEAYRNIRSQMQEASALATDPARSVPGRPMVRAEGVHDPFLAAYDSHVQPWMEEAFTALTQATRTGEPFTLLPCTVNGEPTAAIVHLSHRDDRGRFHVTPLFVAMTPGMVLIDPKGRRAGEESG